MLVMGSTLSAAVLFPFLFANAMQAVLFTSFLYVITIHLCLDFVLFLALIAAYYPSWMPIFVT